MNKKLISFILLLALMCAALCSCGLVKSPDKYEFPDNDSVASITKVVGDRTVKSLQSANQYYKYVFKDVSDTKADVEKYAAYLVSTEKFTANKKYTRIDPTGEIIFTKISSADKSYKITVKVTYDESEYTVEATREKQV